MKIHVNILPLINSGILYLSINALRTTKKGEGKHWTTKKKQLFLKLEKEIRKKGSPLSLRGGGRTTKNYFLLLLLLIRKDQL